MLHELEAKGKSIRAISRETGLSRNTVRKYLRAAGIPERKPHPQRGAYFGHIRTLFSKTSGQ
jgi:transposase